MKVGEIISWLQKKYDKDDEIVIAWWDMTLFSQYDPDTDDDVPLTKEEWSRAMDLMERTPDGWFDEISERAFEYIKYHVDKAVAEKPEA